MKNALYLFLIISVISLFFCGKSKVNNPEDKPPVVNFDTSALVDKSATFETTSLFASMKKSSATGIMIGQQDAFTGRYSTEGDAEMTDMKLTCGKNPLVNGLDFMFITDINNTPGSWFAEQERIIKEQARLSYKNGMIITFSWHFRNPYDFEWFNVEGDADRQKIAAKCISSLLPGGENHNYYKKQLQKIASVLSDLYGENGELIPVIFRPFHEFDGSWFWWGKSYCTAEDFKAIWKFTVEYLRDELGVHNVLYAFAPDNSLDTEAKYLERYPGDEYVDLVGMDNYGDFNNNNISAAAKKLKMISDYAKAHNKLAALTECGYSNNPKPSNIFTKRFYAAIKEQPVELAYMMFWSNSSTGYFVPAPGETCANDFVYFAKLPYTLLEGDVTDIYKFIE